LLWALSSAKNRAKQKPSRSSSERRKVIQEILNVPDDIPQDLLDKARCVVVMPSV